jgi:hypothetical protein
MKARLGYNQMSKKQQKLAIDLAHETFRKEGLGISRRLQKVFCVALNEQFGFGKQRLMRFIEEIDSICENHLDDPIFWVHIDKRLEQIGVPYPNEDYEKMEEK